MVSVAAARPRTSDEPQGATFIELFFDLVFVYALTQVTSLLVHDLTWNGAARAVVVAWLVWWAWTQFTWTLSPADTTHPVVEVVVLAATAVAFFMARSVTETFAGSPWLFLVPYLIIRLIGMSLYAWVGGHADRQMARSMGLFALASVPAMVALLAGAALGPATRTGHAAGIDHRSRLGGGRDRGKWRFGDRACRGGPGADRGYRALTSRRFRPRLARRLIAPDEEASQWFTGALRAPCQVSPGVEPETNRHGAARMVGVVEPNQDAAVGLNLIADGHDLMVV